MSVYKPPKSPFYAYDFKINGRRFHGSTKATNKKEAESVHRRLKAQAKADLEQERLTGEGPLTLNMAAYRYWQEVGQRHAGSDDTWRNLKRLIEYFGPDRRLDEITDSDIADLIAARRSQTKHGKAKDSRGNPTQLIAPATVNRSTTVVLKALFSRAKRTWRYQFLKEPNWRDHWLPEPEERVRELHDHEAEALDAAIRDDYAPWIEFARLTGWRLESTLLRWSSVNWFAKSIVAVGKGGRKVTTPITPEIRSILEPLKGNHVEWVFTFVCRRTRGKQVRGRRYPITYEGAKSQWQRDRKLAGVSDFRFHDFRHDVATKLLRATRNLKLVQKALNHADIATTARYAHVLDEEVADALSSLAKSRKKSRTTDAEAA